MAQGFSKVSTGPSTATGGGTWLGGIGNQKISSIKLNAMATGGLVSGPGTGTSDSILSRLSNGEFVVKAAVTKQFRPLLEYLNSNGSLPAFADGGLVGSSSFLATPMETTFETDKPSSAPTTQTIQINITGDISRQTRAQIQSMIPMIAAGVNQVNYESGYR